MKPKVIARPPKPAPATPARLMFAQVQAIPVPADCPYAQLTDLEVIDSIPAPKLASLLLNWEQRNQIDDEAIYPSDELIASTVRWYLRGLGVEMSVRKTRTDEVHARGYRETAAALDRLEANPIAIEKPILKS